MNLYSQKKLSLFHRKEHVILKTIGTDPPSGSCLILQEVVWFLYKKSGCKFPSFIWAFILRENNIKKTKNEDYSRSSCLYWCRCSLWIHWPTCSIGCLPCCQGCLCSQDPLCCCSKTGLCCPETRLCSSSCLCSTIGLWCPSLCSSWIKDLVTKEIRYFHVFELPSIVACLV